MNHSKGRLLDAAVLETPHLPQKGSPSSQEILGYFGQQHFRKKAGFVPPFSNTEDGSIFGEDTEDWYHLAEELLHISSKYVWHDETMFSIAQRYLGNDLLHDSRLVLALIESVDGEVNQLGISGFKVANQIFDDPIFHMLNLDHATFEYVQAELVDFKNCSLNHTLIVGCEMTQGGFTDVLATRATFVDSLLMSSCIISSSLDECLIFNCNFDHTFIFNSQIKNASFINVNFSGSIFELTDFEDCSFINCNLDNCRFRDSKIINAKYIGTSTVGMTMIAH